MEDFNQNWKQTTDQELKCVLPQHMWRRYRCIPVARVSNEWREIVLNKLGSRSVGRKMIFLLR